MLRPLAVLSAILLASGTAGAAPVTVTLTGEAAVLNASGATTEATFAAFGLVHAGDPLQISITYQAPVAIDGIDDSAAPLLTKFILDSAAISSWTIAIDGNVHDVLSLAETTHLIAETAPGVNDRLVFDATNLAAGEVGGLVVDFQGLPVGLADAGFDLGALDLGTADIGALYTGLPAGGGVVALGFDTPPMVTVMGVPEPSTCALFGLGLSILGLATAAGRSRRLMITAAAAERASG